MDCVTSRIDIGESLDPLDEFRVENDIRTFGTRPANLLHENLRTHRMCMIVYCRLRVSAMGGEAGVLRVAVEENLAVIQVCRISNHAPATNHHVSI